MEVIAPMIVGKVLDQPSNLASPPLSIINKILIVTALKEEKICSNFQHIFTIGVSFPYGEESSNGNKDRIVQGFLDRGKVNQTPNEELINVKVVIAVNHTILRCGANY